MLYNQLPAHGFAPSGRNAPLSRVCLLFGVLGALACPSSAQDSPDSAPSDPPLAENSTGFKLRNVPDPKASLVPDTLRSDPSLRAGRPTQAWKLTQARELTVSVSGAVQDSKDYLEFWLYLPERASAGRIGFRLGNRSDSLILSWVGWRRISIPLAVMGKNKAEGEPDQLYLTREGEFPADYTVYLQDARRVSVSTGAGITEEDLLDHLDFTRPGLAAVRMAMEKNQKAEALAALAAYFRQDFTARMPWTGLAGHAVTEDKEEKRRKVVEAADKLLAGTVTHADNTYTFPGGDVDWRFNPTAGTDKFTYEWGFSLNRHGIWEPITLAYEATRDEKYADLWVRQFRRWVEQMPAPGIDEERGDSGWRGLEAGLRFSRIWPSAFFSVAPAKAVKDEDILLFLRSVVDHGNFLSGHPYSPGNHFLLAMCGLFTQGVTFPELKDSSYWRRRGLEQLTLSLDRNTVPEGAWYEFAPGYHQWVVNRTMTAFRIAQINGFGQEVAPSLWAHLEKMASWNVRMSGPDGLVPTVNDGGKVIIAQSVATSSIVFPENPLLRWAAQRENAKSPPPPQQPSYALPDSGYTIFRTGWGSKDSYVLFDVGPLGGWHGHHDALNIVTYFYGRPFLFDNGGWAYDATIWRKYGPSTASHNTVLVDGLGQWRGYSRADPIGLNPANTPPPVFATSSTVDYASGWYVADYGKKGAAEPIAHHRRELAFLKGESPLLVVVDTLAPLDTKEHRYEARWHLLSTKWNEDKKARVLWTTDAGKPNLAVLALAGAEEFHADSGVTTPEVLGWSYDGQTGGPYPALTLRQAVTGSGVKRLVTVFIPFKGKPGNPVTSVRRNGTNQWVIALKGQNPVTLELAEQAAGSQPSFTLRGVAWPKPQ